MAAMVLEDTVNKHLSEALVMPSGGADGRTGKRHKDTQRVDKGRRKP